MRICEGLLSMATTVQSFLFTAKRCQCRIAAQARMSRPIGGRRSFTTSPSRWDEEPTKDPDVYTRESLNAHLDELRARVTQRNPNSTPPKRDAKLDAAFEKMVQELGRSSRDVPNELRNAPPFREIRIGKPKPGLLNMGENLADAPEEDPEFEEDDISSLAHGELEQHREFREYARLAAWEMPLLTKMAKPFVPPTQKEVLRFRYTTYMGEEHPAEKKVVLEFCPADMPDLTAVQREKLKKLVGVRYNPETDIIKMSCEMFESQAQNKRYLGDLVDTLLREARDPRDTFEDIPLDTRHHPIKVKPKFPIEWRMTEQRKAELEASRQRAALTDKQKALQGAIVDGVRQIQAALKKPTHTPEAEADPQMVMAQKGQVNSRKLRQRADRI